ncbi:MAG TPA: hypothetical protein VJB87_02000 [Candidatus Nanoarchaeia archaeon]|nr:hypothetical protein [Candidatus Nanoarchaeia archaeon]
MAHSEKRAIIDQIFKRFKPEDLQKMILRFDNDEVKKVSGSSFRNQFDATKFDTSKKLPKSVCDAGFFIVHLGQGRHALVKGEGYHKFEGVNTVKEWKIKKSVIENISESEAQSASTAFNNKIIHDFLFSNVNKDIQLHTARRARTSYDFIINGIKLRAEALQIEMDGIYESEEEKTIAAIEVKNQEHEDFEIRQLYSTMRYFEDRRGSEVPADYNFRILFMVRIKNEKENKFKIYEYNFSDKNDPNSIKFIKAIQYNIIKE